MPSLTVTYPSGGLSEGSVDALAADLTSILLRWEGVPETPLTRRLCWLEFVEADHHFSGGVRTEVPRFRVHLTLPTDVLDEAAMRGLVEDVTSRVLRAAGGPADGRRVWVIVTEVPDGRWGYAGEVADLDTIRIAAGRA